MASFVQCHSPTESLLIISLWIDVYSQCRRAVFQDIKSVAERIPSVGQTGYHPRLSAGPPQMKGRHTLRLSDPLHL